MSDKPMIQVQKLTKRYGAKLALDNISFEVPSGQVLGFIGPNGAGKTTTMKVLTCTISASSGSASIAGLDVMQRSLAVRQRVGYLPEDTPLYPDLTVLELLRFVARLRQVPASKQTERLGAVVEVCGLMSVLGEPVGVLSKGYRQRVGLAQAMVHDPPVLILDEPISGLDPNQIVDIRRLIRHVGQEKTVILSSHILPIVEATCGRIILISGGRLLADGSVEQVLQQHGLHRLTLRLGGAAGEDEQAVRSELAGVESVQGCTAEASPGSFTLHVAVDALEQAQQEVEQLVKARQWELVQLTPSPPSLEDVFRHLTAPPARPS